MAELHRIHPENEPPAEEWKLSTARLAAKAALESLGFDGDHRDGDYSGLDPETYSGHRRPMERMGLMRMNVAVATSTRLATLMALTPLQDDAIAGPEHWERRRTLGINAVLEGLSAGQTLLYRAEYMTTQIAESGRNEETKEITKIQARRLQSCLNWTVPLIAARDGLETRAR